MTTKPNPHPSISLLIVEDCNHTLKSYSTILSMLCPEVTIHIACNGTTGLEVFKAHQPEIVITDYNMPELDGWQMADKIRAIKLDTKIIVITGDKEKLEQKDLVGKKVTIDHLIQKPIDFQLLVDAIQQCLDEITLKGS